jgi:hypothetical protein
MDNSGAEGFDVADKARTTLIEHQHDGFACGGKLTD